MAMYKYVGRNPKGAVKRGTIEASSKNDAILQLRKNKISAREVNETKGNIFNTDLNIGGSGVKNQDFVIYCRQFATLIRAGVPLVESTKILADQSESKGLSKALNKVQQDVREGKSFSEALKKFPKIFPQLFINMIRSGEVTGNLDETLDRLAEYYEKQHQLKKKVQSTMAYPVVLLVLVVGVVIFLLLSIIPKFTGMFEQFDAELPAITQLVVKMSDFVQYYWWLGLLIVGGVVGGFMFLYKTNKEFNFAVNVILLKVPIFGKLLQKSAIARMMRTLSSLFSSSVPILQALGIVAKVVENPVITKMIYESHASLERGQSIAEPMKNAWFIPSLVTQMTEIGEQTGQLDYMLAKVADFYEEEVDRTVDALKSIIEPIMIIILATVVGFIVMSIMIPMFTIFTEIG